MFSVVCAFCVSGVRVKGRDFNEERATKNAYLPRAVSESPSYEPVGGVILLADIDETDIGSDVRLIHLTVRPSVCEEKGPEKCVVPYLLPPVPLGKEVPPNHNSRDVGSFGCMYSLAKDGTPRDTRYTRIPLSFFPSPLPPGEETDHGGGRYRRVPVLSFRDAWKECSHRRCVYMLHCLPRIHVRHKCISGQICECLREGALFMRVACAGGKGEPRTAVQMKRQIKREREGALFRSSPPDICHVLMSRVNLQTVCL